MTLRVVVPLLAICLASPAITNAEQAQRGRGYRQRDGAGTTAEKSGGDAKAKAAERTTDNNNRVAERRTETRAAEPAAETRAAETTTAEREPEPTRYAVPRSNAGGYVVNRPVDNPPVVVTRDRHDVIVYRHPGQYHPAQYNYWARRYYSYGPIGYAPWLIHGSIGFSNFGFVGGFGPAPSYYYNAYGYGAPYPWAAGSYDAGGIRLKVDPRDAEVFVDGYYAGLVDDFDGLFQALKVAPGGHKIEIQMSGFHDLQLDVHVQPGRTVTLSEQMRPRP